MRESVEETEMKILIASDIHGSAACCERMVEAFKREGAQRLLLLGDLLYHGPRNDLPEGHDPKAVIGMLNGLDAPVSSVRGNCEAEVDQVVLSFPCLADYMLLPLGERTVFVTHGHRYNKENLPPLRDGDVLLTGHTHIPAWEDCGNFYYFNPGSVSIPKNAPRTYMTLEGTTFTWKTMDGETLHSVTL